MHGLEIGELVQWVDSCLEYSESGFIPSISDGPLNPPKKDPLMQSHQIWPPKMGATPRWSKWIYKLWHGQNLEINQNAELMGRHCWEALWS